MFSKNDKIKINELEDDYLSLVSQITIANGKLDFIEEKITDRLSTMQSNFDRIATSNESLKLTIKDVIKAVIENRKSLKSISSKSFSGNVELTCKTTNIDLSKSLKENIVFLDSKINSLILSLDKNNKKIDKLEKRVNFLISVYNQQKRYRLIFSWVCDKIKALLKTLYKYTIKSVAMRISFYIITIIGLSPKAMEFVEKIISILTGE